MRPATDPSHRGASQGGSPPIYKPGPDVRTTALPGGGMMHVNPNARSRVSTDAGGRIMAIEKPGLTARTFGSDGRAAHIERTRDDGSRVIVDRGFHDGRRVEVVRPGGVRVVTHGSVGFVERPLRRDYVTRTYVVGGRSTVYVYRTGYYRSYPYWTYVPAVVYAPAYYGWAIRPWGLGVAYAWAPTPWMGVWGGWYTPERIYSTPALWLTDYAISDNLNVAYQMQLASGAPMQYVEPAQMGAPLSPQVKGMLAEQVRQQLEADQVAATQPVVQAAAAAGPAALDPAIRLFVVSTSIDVVSSANGQTCTLTPGDVVQRTSDSVTSDGKVSVVVVSGKSAECPANFQTAFDLATLQDMHNQFRERIASGLDKLASTAGTGGMPAAPAANPRLVPEGQAPVDGEAKNLLLAQTREADQAEEEVKLAMDSAI